MKLVILNKSAMGYHYDEFLLIFLHFDAHVRVELGADNGCSNEMDFVLSDI